MPSKKSKKKSGKKKKVPFVSICTPTFNRRPFFELCFMCLQNQTYPHDRLEWLIYDDGTNPVKDIIDEFAKTTNINVRYFRNETALPLSQKRNFLNDKADGAFLCYWDDDDYYQPDRIKNSVKALQSHPECLVAGGSTMYCYFNDTGEIWRFGPYGENHTTAAVLFFRKELLETTKFDEKAYLAEEKAFLKNYTIPMHQMPPGQTILVVAHSQNSFDKRALIENGDTQFVKKTKMTLEQVVKEPAARHFITSKLEPALASYTDGDVRKKPDVLLSMLNILRERHNNLKKEYTKVALSHNNLVRQLQAMSTQKGTVSNNSQGAPLNTTNPGSVPVPGFPNGPPAPPSQSTANQPTANGRTPMRVMQ